MLGEVCESVEEVWKSVLGRGEGEGSVGKVWGCGESVGEVWEVCYGVRGGEG